MTRLEWRSTNERETIGFGEALGAALVAPVWVGLSGTLGAGKTRLVQGIAAGLGYGGRVRSPSFVLEHRYPARVPLRHLDLYRLESGFGDLEAAWEEDDRSVVVVEWADRVTARPARSISIRLDFEAAPPKGAGGLQPALGEEPARWIHLSWSAPGLLRDWDLRRARLGADALRHVATIPPGSTLSLAASERDEPGQGKAAGAR